MYKALMNSLFLNDREKYEDIRKRALGFLSCYSGNNIMQDDIFHVIENYVFQNGMYLEMLRYPTEDDNFCACTFIRNGRVFVLINTNMPLSKQIFAAAHEFYHLFNCFEENDLDYEKDRSILDSATIDEETTRLEDMEANAFAGLILAPGRSLQEQMEIYRIRRDSIGIKEILLLMEIYAIPYKAMVLRLFEEGINSIDKTKHFFQIRSSTIQHQCELTGRALRWQKNTKNDILLGSLIENMERVAELDAVPKERYTQDKAFLAHIKETIVLNR